MRSVLPVLERIQETPSTVTLRFDVPWSAGAGQYVMLWVPGDDELPMSLSYTGPRAGVTVKVMGETSRNIQRIQVGTRVGIRGPYGNRFAESPKRLLIVAGGSGAAVLAPGAEQVRAHGGEVAVALGATTAAELLFERRFRAMGAEVRLATDDGSTGTKGYVTNVADAWMKESRFDAVWTCGPEVMMRKVLDAAHASGIASYGSVERVMKCSLGICDACALGPYHVCVDGPVFEGERLRGLEEFGLLKRDFSGRHVPI